MLNFHPNAGYAAIARISESVSLLAVQQILALGNAMDIIGCRQQSVDQSGFGIDSDLGRHPKVVLISLLCLVLSGSRALPLSWENSGQRS